MRGVVPIAPGKESEGSRYMYAKRTTSRAIRRIGRSAPVTSQRKGKVGCGRWEGRMEKEGKAKQSRRALSFETGDVTMGGALQHVKREIMDPVGGSDGDVWTDPSQAPYKKGERRLVSGLPQNRPMARAMIGWMRACPVNHSERKPLLLNVCWRRGTVSRHVISSIGWKWADPGAY